MATIIAPAKLSPVVGFAIVCDHCDDGSGYLSITTVDEYGMYDYRARCFYCNHRDRDQSICSCH